MQAGGRVFPTVTPKQQKNGLRGATLEQKKDTGDREDSKDSWKFPNPICRSDRYHFIAGSLKNHYIAHAVLECGDVPLTLPVQFWGYMPCATAPGFKDPFVSP